MESRRSEMPYHQRHILQKFRSNVDDILTSYHTDDVLIKFLRVRNFDLKEAEDNFRLVDSTRKLYFIDTFTPDNRVVNEVIEKYRADSFIGYAKDGTPIRYVTARCDFSGFLQVSSSYDLILYCCYVIERDLKLIKNDKLKTGRDSNEVTYIFDMEGYSLQDFTYKYFIETSLNFLDIAQDIYPEIWRVILFINVPYIFDKIFYVFKTILKETFVEKMKVANKSSSKELLRMYIDDDVLPAFLGGKKVDSKGDPCCKEFINQAGKIPENYYLRNCAHLIDITDPDVQTAVIRPRSVFNVPLTVRKARTKFRLEYRTENGGLMTSILYRDIGPKPENPDLPAEDEILNPNDEQSNVRRVSVKLRVQSQLAPHNVDCIAINPGIYIVQFDNTGGWFSSRKLFYRITTSS